MNDINACSWQSEANCGKKLTAINKTNTKKTTDEEQSARN